MNKGRLVGHSVLAIMFLAAILICLAAYGYIGSFMRLSGDDYCYAAHLSQGSFWQAQVNSYLEVSTYNANRFSLTFFSGLAGLFPPIVNGFLPGLVIVLWFIGLVFALRSIFTALKLRIPLWFCALLAALVEFVTLYQAPDISQSLYWRSGMLPYLLPVVGQTYLFAMLIRAWSRERISWIFAPSLFLLAFVSGGFSEVANFFQIGWLGLMWLVTWMLDRRAGKKSPKANVVFLLAMAATLLALSLLALSPTNQMRRAGDSSLPGLFELLEIIGLFAIKFFARSFRDQPIPTVYSLLVPFLFGMVVLHPLGIQPKSPITVRRLLPWVVGSQMAYLFLVAGSSIPFAIIQSAVPEPRAQIIARFVMTLSLVGSGLLLGLFVAEKAHQLKIPSFRMVQLVGVLVLVLAALYPLRAAGQVYQTAPRYQKWANFWDMRDEDIQTARLQGVSDVQVIEIDHIIDRVGDLSPDPAYWYNTCAAMYYQVHSIRADLPGWDQ